jgi:glycine cleavage system H protein
MNTPEGLYYTQEHEWIAVDGDIGTIGITDHAQSELGDVVFVELPEPGMRVTAGDAFASVESVKAVSQIYAPVGGEIIESNENLTNSPEIVNQEPYGGGWMVRIELEDTTELHGLMSAAEYVRFVKEESGG